MKRVAILVLLVALVGVAACGGRKVVSARPGASPRETVERLQRAIEGGDYRGFTALLAPQSRRGEVVSLLDSLNQYVTSEERLKRRADEIKADPTGRSRAVAERMRAIRAHINEAMETAGLPGAFERLQKITEGTDRLDLDVRIEAVEAVLREQGAKADFDALHPRLVDAWDRVLELQRPGSVDRRRRSLSGPVGSVRVDGEKATVRIGRMTLELVRVDGLWYVRP